MARLPEWKGTALNTWFPSQDQVPAGSLPPKHSGSSLHALALSSAARPAPINPSFQLFLESTAYFPPGRIPGTRKEISWKQNGLRAGEQTLLRLRGNFAPLHSLLGSPPLHSFLKFFILRPLVSDLAPQNPKLRGQWLNHSKNQT